MTELPAVAVHTDGACVGNPGPGGYAAVVIDGDSRSELVGGARLTTNNRMELLAAIVALESLPGARRVTLFSDSRYVIEAMAKGWVVRWRQNGWKRGPTSPLANADLWRRLVAASARHEVTWNWVRGHAGDAENERCDRLATAMASPAGLPADEGYEAAIAQEGGLFG